MVRRHPWSAASLCFAVVVVLLAASASQAVSQGHKKPAAPPSMRPDFCTPPGCPPPFYYGVSVTPDGTQVSWPSNTSGHTAQFTVTNAGNTSNTFNLSCTTSGSVSCTGLSASSVTYGAGVSGTVTATYSVGDPGSGVLILTAVGGGGAQDNGSYNVTVTAPPPPAPAVSVTPDGVTAPNRPANTAGYSQTFTITNTGNVQTTYTLSCGGASNVIFLK